MGISVIRPWILGDPGRPSLYTTTKKKDKEKSEPKTYVLSKNCAAVVLLF